MNASGPLSAPKQAGRRVLIVDDEADLASVRFVRKKDQPDIEQGKIAEQVAMSSDWEVFASMLVKDLGRKLGAGVDLSEHEVKSALDGSSYEYQYHKNTGKDKLQKDMEVGHLFFAHREFLRHVDLRYAHGSQMKEFFTKWLRDYPDPYPQRYRKNIPFHWVKENAILLMTLENGEVTFPKPHSKPETHT